MQGIVLLERQRVAVRHDLPEAECPPDGVVVRVRACGICGGDLKVYREWNGPFPKFLGGHEFTGEIVRVGSEVSQFRAGDEVIQCFGPHCGQCVNCRNGSYSFCLARRQLTNSGGGFAELVSVVTPEGGAGLFHRPATFSDAMAAACEPASCAISAALRSQPEPGNWAAVVGLGAIGHFICQTLHSMGVKAIGIDVSDNRLNAAAPYCVETINSNRREPVASVLEITGGIGVDRSYEAVGIEATLAATLQMTRVGGVAVLAGVFRHPVASFDPEWIFRRDLTVIGGKGRPLVTTQGQALAIDLIQRGRLHPEVVLTEYPRSQAAEAFAAQNAADCVKAVLMAND
jgi:threonine dehydrogenase-like Zn-dependent dehydrogenase